MPNLVRLLEVVLLLTLCICSCPANSMAECGGSSPTWVASDATRSEVQSCIDSASDGDTVNVPAGTAEWISDVVVPNTKGLTILGGYGGGTTTISGSGITIYPAMNKLNDISGFTFTFSSTDYAITINSLPYKDCVGENLCSDVIKIHDCTFNSASIRVYGRVIGVIYRNTFAKTTPYSIIRLFRDPSTEGSPTNGSDGGSAEWTMDTELGSSNFIFIEGNTVVIDSPNVGASFVTGRSGMRYVARYNTVKNLNLTHHAAEIAYDRGTRAFEIYNNLIWFTDDIQGAIYPIRGGTGVFFSNRVQGTKFSQTSPNDKPLVITEPRVVEIVEERNPWSSECNGSAGKFCLGGPPIRCEVDNNCTGTINGYSVTGPCVDIDGGEGANGYPCRDQWGRGKTNATTGVQNQEPVLAWDNKFCLASGGDCDADYGSLFGLYTSSAYADYIQPNRDFCDRVCTGTSTPCAVDGDCGAATCDMSVAMPATCGGITSPSYASYTCPHPLTGLTGSCDSSVAGTAGYNIASTPNSHRGRATGNFKGSIK